MGYETAMVFVNTDPETAQARNAKRARTLPQKKLKQCGKMFKRILVNFKPLDVICLLLIIRMEQIGKGSTTL